MIHPNDREFVERHLAHSLATKTIYQAEYRITRPDGFPGWIYATGRTIYGPDGKPRRIMGVTIDITERRIAEQSLRENEAQLRALADSIPQLAWAADRRGHHIWYNKRWFDYTGTTLDEMRGMGWKSVHDPEVLPRVLEAWEEAMATGCPFEMEHPLRRADGVFRWFLTRVEPVCNAQGDVVQWFGTNTDIDEKRIAEVALRESEELARSVIENSPDCVEVLDGKGRLLLLNAECCRVLGIGDRAARLNEPWVDSWAREECEKAAEAIATALSGKSAKFESTGRTGTEGRKCWDVIVSPILGPDGSPFKLLCVSRDITARRQEEERMMQTAKLESLGVMAGGIAHDFNNLLTGILGNASLLATSVSEADRPLAEDVALAAERAADLTRQLLAYSGKARFEFRRIDISARVLEILRLVKPSIEKNVEMRLQLSDQPCLISGDPGQIQQLIMNLVINAGEAIEGKPGTVVVRTGTLNVDSAGVDPGFQPSDIPPGDYVFLEVSDNGKGMDNELKSKIFDPFFTTKFTGRGLGLASVSGIVRGHNGAMRVDSTPGKGTAFRVLFPAVASFEVPSGKINPTASVGAGLILLVDDEDIVRRIGKAALEFHGFDVELACDGREAVDRFVELQDHLDAMVLDMTMPVMSGDEVLRRVSQLRTDIPVIVCSGYSEMEVTNKFANQKIAGFIQKPYTAPDLARAVKSVVNSSKRAGS
jgi:PAS domain S-box-containing protein